VRKMAIRITSSRVATSMKRDVPVRAASWLTDVPMGPPDALFGLIDAFNKDPAEKKISLGIGAYRDDLNKPHVLPTIREAERRLLEAKMNHEYAGIDGVADFVKLSLQFQYGKDSKALANGRICGVQSISGTGGLRLGGQFFARFRGSSAFYLPNPTWANHIPIFKDSGLDVKSYSYYDPKTCGLNFSGMMDDVNAAPEGSTFLLHSCAHNPTGVDPSEEQWREISALMLKKRHAVFFDSAYQGFASGDAERDAFAVRHFVDEGHSMLLSQSYSKNFGLYGERAGALSAVCADAEEAERVKSQLKILIRPMYSNPPIYGARLVAIILADPALKAEWEKDCKEMADRITSMRKALVSELAAAGSTRDWSHITKQIGMFCYSGLTNEEVLTIRKDRSVYMTGDGRVSMAGVTSGNVKYLAESMHAVTK